MKHMIAAEELEASYERRLALELQRFNRLQEEAQDYKLAASETMGQMEEAHETAAEQSEREAAGFNTSPLFSTQPEPFSHH